MGIDDIKETLAAEMDKVNVSDSYKTTMDIEDGLLALWENPEHEKGDNLRWVNVELALKPELYLLTGIPSSGKSTWLDNIIINSAQMHDYKWAVFSPESHPLEMHMKQLIEMHTCTNFYGAYNYQRTTKEDIRNSLRSLSDKIYMLTPSEQDMSIESILELIEYLVVEKGVNAFVLDPYNEFSHTRPNGISETEYVSRFLGRIRAFINEHNVMAWIVAHPTKLRKEDITLQNGAKVFDYPVPTAYDVAGSANFFNKPDNIIAVHRDKNIERNPDNLVSINIQKVRRKTTGKLGSYWLKFNFNDGTFTSWSGE